ncbi:sensor histidine kinase [Cytophaga hutchinsonii]|jgi:two-component system sensor histidine kinase/response regulator|uniref:histidine kinase n=1 Tax=Cytophaga hutchinsonii (strain ATCC 33406 / DSM 1761 / CIP 103989 / NBRC 15051 / NCIMB 9469 / D465) TaxID=269798 RepID=A0A6N4SVY2_CYTH3|nr:HAMP domain-containing sensor histidine kinase [Cytophaga hutchinsonii]ABG60773.1 sensor for ctr capsule biosynthesis, probable histidine kinase acting on RcsB [Cytophaga hutchinsonii ATCC 33406]SFX71636.1 hypothetical protein SAMN04487930_10899 [Cytophaga hutchinsonii ATCC 33406]
MNKIFSPKILTENSIDAKRNFIAKVTIALCFVLSVGFSIVFFIQKIYPLNIIFAFFSIVYVIAWSMYELKNPLAAKVMLYSAMLAQVFFMAIVLGVFVEIKVFFIPIAIVPLLIFSKKEKVPMYALLILTAVNIVMINTFVHRIYGPEQIYSFETYRNINNAFDITSMLCMVILAFLFLQLTEAGEIELIDANKALSKQKEVELQNNFLLKRAKEDQERMNLMKDHLFRIISHDLRSPINTIHGLTELLISKKLSREEETVITEQLKKSTDSTNQLLDNLLSWSAFQINNASKPNIVEVNIKELINDIFKQLDVKLTQKNISIIEKIDHTIFIQADSSMLEIVIRNIISNAIKFSYQEQVIHVHAEIADRDLVIQVKDSGIGMPKEILDKLFTNDKSVSRAGTYNEKGSGIGLLLCKNLLENCGGKIEAKSIPKQQTIFTIKLPMN